MSPCQVCIIALLLFALITPLHGSHEENIDSRLQAENDLEFSPEPIDTLPWPMSLPPRVTSTFGEFRRGHLHAGIDLSTYGRSGYALRAIDSGCLLRIRVDPEGYGNTIYLSLDNGMIVVFAHMKRFARKVRSFVEQMQEETGRCVVDFYVEPDRVRFEKGEIVGISGGTGVGPPHVHMELRNQFNEPINPLLGSYALADSTPPRFYRFVMTPLGADAHVNGRRRSRTIRLRFDRESKQYQALSTPQIWGEIGLSVRAFDRINLAGDKVGVYHYSLRVDGEEIFDRTYERMEVEEWRQTDVIYDRDLERRGFGRCERLYRMQGDNLALHRNSTGDGIIRAGFGTLDYGHHTVEVFVADAAGNHRTAVLPLLVNSTPELVSLQRAGGESLSVELSDEDVENCRVSFRRKRSGRWQSATAQRIDERTWTLPGHNWNELLECQTTDPHGLRSAPHYYSAVTGSTGVLNFTADHQLESRLLTISLRSDTDLARTPVAFVSPGEFGFTPVRLRAIDERSYEMELSLLPEAMPAYRILIIAQGLDGTIGRRELTIPLQALLVNEPAKIASNDGNAHIHAPQGAVYEDTYIEVSQIALSDPGGGMELISPGYRFGPEQAILKTPVTIGISSPIDDFPNNGNGIGLFKWKTGSSYQIVGAAYDSTTSTVMGTTESLGVFALLRDAHPPRVEIRHRQGTAFSGGRPALQASVSDLGSGVNYRDVQMFLDGRPVPACPLGGGRWSYRPRKSLSQGEHTVRITARDKVGNPAAAQIAFTTR